MNNEVNEPQRKYRESNNVNSEDLWKLKHFRCLIAHEKRGDEDKHVVAKMNRFR
jgi:predicted transglutaminase-like cysteine proteinase